MLNGPRFAVFVGRGSNPTEFHYCHLRLKEARAAVTIIGLDRLKYRLEDLPLGFAKTTIDNVINYSCLIIPDKESLCTF